MLLSRDTLDEASEARSSPRKMTRSPLVTAAARLWATLFYGHVHRPEDRDAVVKGDTLLACVPRVALGLRAAREHDVGACTSFTRTGPRLRVGHLGNGASRRERRELPLGRARFW